jgi:6-phosphofructokinase 1
VDKIRDTADSHDRVFFIEVMGRDSGYIAIQTGIGCGAELVMVPENPDTLEGVIETLKGGRDRKKSSAVVIVAEGEEAGNAHYIALKVKEVLTHLDIRVTTLGHVQRGGSPTAIDRILGSRLGLAAVEGLIEGRSNVMAGIVNDQVVYTSFGDSINKKKPFNKDLIRMVNILNT